MSSEIPYKPRKRPQQDRSKITNEAILEATAHILTDKGYDKLTTNHIAQKAGISIGSLYQYYPNKESIIAELIKRSVQEDRLFIESKLEELRKAPLETAVRHLVDNIMDRCDSDLPMALALRKQIPRVKWTEKMRKTSSYLEQSIFDLLSSRYPKVNTKHLKRIAFIVVQTIDGIVNEALFSHPGWLSDKKFRASVCTLITNYLKPELGQII